MMWSNILISSLLLDAAAAWPYLAEQAAAKRKSKPFGDQIPHMTDVILQDRQPLR